MQNKPLIRQMGRRALPRVLRPLVVCFALLPGTAQLAAAQSSGAAATSPPWLSQTLDPTLSEPPATPPERPAEITVTPLDSPGSAATGLISPRKAGLPEDLWLGSDPEQLAQLFYQVPVLSNPALQSMLDRIVLVEAQPPLGSSDTLLLARIDTLLRRGALEPAQALLERAGPDTPDLFRRWFDISLLTGTEDRACATLAAKPDLSPNYETRIFCLARDGRWPTAALTLETATALGRITPEARDRLARFLDPEIFEGEPMGPLPDPMTPLDFRLLEAVGEPVPTRSLPLAFAQTDLRHVVGWKAQIEAAERLARAGALSPNQLLGIYTARRPAASGGVWERVAAVQALDIALAAGDAERTGKALQRAQEVMRAADLDAVLAALFAPRLNRLPVPSASAAEAYRLTLLSNGRDAFRAPPDSADLTPRLAFAAALANGAAEAALPPDTLSALVQTGMGADDIPDSYASYIEEKRVGEALLIALTHLADGRDGNPADLAQALQLLRALGFDTESRHAALQLLLLDSHI